MTHPTSATPPPLQRVRSIQYLRAVAALSVVAYHASKRVEDGLSDTAEGFFHLGHGGVDLFFVISGFIMWSIGCNAPRDPGAFLVRRIIRVAPPYWIATLAWVAFMLVSGAAWIVITPAHVLQSLLFVPHWSPTFPDTFWPVLVPGWTLLFEMYFYALFALVLLAAPRFRLVTLSALLVSLMGLGTLAASSVAAVQAYTSPLLLEFLAGCWIAEAWRRGLNGRVLGIVLCALGVLVLLFSTPFATPDQTSWSRPLTFGLAGALIVTGAIAVERYLPNWMWLERLGDASYAIYLFHMFIVTIFGALANRFALADTAVGAYGFVILCIATSSVLGWWLFANVERPIQKRLNAGWSRLNPKLRAEWQ